MNNFFKNFVSILLSIILLMSVLTGCKTKQNSFPSLSLPSDETIETTSNDFAEGINENSTVTELTVALPYSENTVNLLFRLYYAKSNGLLNEQFSDYESKINYLNSLDLPWVINSIITSSEGVDISTASLWESSNSLPDIMLVNDINAFNEAGINTSLNNYLSDNELISGTNLNYTVLMSGNNDGVFLGIPHYVSVMLLAGNKEFSPDDLTLPFRPSTDDFDNYLSLTYQNSINSDDNDEVVVFPYLYELLPYMSSAFNNDNRTSYLFYNELQSDEESYESMFNASIEYIESLYDLNYAFSEDIDVDPRISRNAALWLISSSEVEMWSEYYLDNLFITMLPQSNSSNDLILYASPYYLCVSESCINKDLASNFAAFICLDTDALEIIYRNEPQIGYFPIVNNDYVWDILSENSLLGTESIIIHQYINNCVICPSVGSDTYTRVNTYCSNYFENDVEEDFIYEEAFND